METVSSEVIWHQKMLKETPHKLRILIPPWHIMVSIVRHDNRAMLHCMTDNVDVFILLNSVEYMRFSHFLQVFEVVWPLAINLHYKEKLTLVFAFGLSMGDEQIKSQTVKILRVQISAD